MNAVKGNAVVGPDVIIVKSWTSFFKVVTPCGLTGKYKSIERTHCLILQGSSALMYISKLREGEGEA